MNPLLRNYTRIILVHLYNHCTKFRASLDSERYFWCIPQNNSEQRNVLQEIYSKYFPAQFHLNMDMKVVWGVYMNTWHHFEANIFFELNCQGKTYIYVLHMTRKTDSM